MMLWSMNMSDSRLLGLMIRKLLHNLPELQEKLLEYQIETLPATTGNMAWMNVTGKHVTIVTTQSLQARHYENGFFIGVWKQLYQWNLNTKYMQTTTTNSLHSTPFRIILSRGNAVIKPDAMLYARLLIEHWEHAGKTQVTLLINSMAR